MPNAPFRVALVIAFLSMSSIIATQLYLVNLAQNNKEQQFNHSVQMALRNVSESVCQVTGIDAPTEDPIHQVSSNYFIVRTNSNIDLASLEYHLKAELQKKEITIDFEYGVYDCQSENMIYGNLVSLGDESNQISKDYTFPKLKDYDYYFGIYFPTKSNSILLSIDWWKYTSVFTVLLLLFFSYTLFIMLRQKRLGAIQKDFINNVTHELKTPLATLKIASEVIKKDVEPHEIRRNKYADIIAGEVSRLEKHVDQILRSALVEETGRTELEKVHLGKIIKNVINLIDRKGKDFRLDIHEAVILGNQYLVETIAFNLIENAVKYGGDQIKISVLASDGVYLSVYDSGRGIPNELKGKIFQKFYRVPQGDQHDVQGFGLGLFVVKEAAKKLNATLTTKSQENGCEFVVKFRKP